MTLVSALNLASSSKTSIGLRFACLSTWWLEYTTPYCGAVFRGGGSGYSGKIGGGKL